MPFESSEVSSNQPDGVRKSSVQTFLGQFVLVFHSNIENGEAQFKKKPPVHSLSNVLEPLITFNWSFCNTLRSRWHSIEEGRSLKADCGCVICPLQPAAGLRSLGLIVFLPYFYFGTTHTISSTIKHFSFPFMLVCPFKYILFCSIYWKYQNLSKIRYIHKCVRKTK